MEAERQPGLLGRRPQPVPGGIAGIEVEDVDDRAPVTLVGDALQFRGRRLRGCGWGGTRDTEPVGSEGVELLNGPVVPRRVADVLQVRLGDPEREWTDRR